MVWDDALEGNNNITVDGVDVNANLTTSVKLGHQVSKLLSWVIKQT